MTAIEKFQAMADRKPNFLAGDAGYEIRKENLIYQMICEGKKSAVHILTADRKWIDTLTVAQAIRKLS